MPYLVVDTSAVLAVLLHEMTRAALLSATEGYGLVGAPSLPWEVGNALIAGVRRRRLSAEAVRQAWTSYQAVPVRLAEIDPRHALDIGGMGKFLWYARPLVPALLWRCLGWTPTSLAKKSWGLCARAVGRPIVSSNGGSRLTGRRGGRRKNRAAEHLEWLGFCGTHLALLRALHRLWRQAVFSDGGHPRETACPQPMQRTGFEVKEPVAAG